jgi:hypothetical protein
VSTSNAVEIVGFVGSKRTLQLMSVWMSVSDCNLDLHDIPDAVQVLGRWRFFGVVWLKVKEQKAGDL